MRVECLNAKQLLFFAKIATANHHVLTGPDHCRTLGRVGNVPVTKRLHTRGGCDLAGAGRLGGTDSFLTQMAACVAPLPWCQPLKV